MNTFMRPDTQYPRCETSQESVPAIGYSAEEIEALKESGAVAGPGAATRGVFRA